MGTLAKFKAAEQLPLGVLLAEAGVGVVEAGVGVIKAGDLVTHVDHRDFRAKVESVDNGRCMLKVLGGWRGRVLPTWPVGIPTIKLEVAG